MNTRTISITGICLFIVIAVIYFLSGASSESAPDISVRASTTPEVAEARPVPYGWQEYRNVAYRFSLLHPQELEVKEYPEGGNALTITFQNAKKQEGFQIFVVPYQESQVSEERFRQDLPSGVRTGVTDVTVGGVTGAAFYSANATLGETLEMWFIHEGFLFEVTTLKPLDIWLTKIMQTLEFI